ncbi:putative AUGMIN subunit 5 [Cocos nucifera]|uniref:Putative AUGMIN subunit 5 n=1 Tax=Cocos nucifera TaxID=13894 RepID=A0A8K0MV62_COCNU|nr:putative AUGMIN subunit 5 [Cocos nucifera]
MNAGPRGLHSAAGGDLRVATGRDGLPSAAALRHPAPQDLAGEVAMWSFLLQRVRSERAVMTARQNIMVHGVPPSGDEGMGGGGKGRWGSLRWARLSRPGRPCRGRGSGGGGSGEARNVVRRQRNGHGWVRSPGRSQSGRGCLTAGLMPVRIPVVVGMQSVIFFSHWFSLLRDENATGKHKQVTLEAYDRQCDEAAKILAKHQTRLHHCVNQARVVRRLTTDSADNVADDLHAHGEKEAVYSIIKGNKSSIDIIFIETSRERDTGKHVKLLLLI